MENSKFQCPVCNKLIEEKEYDFHIINCKNKINNNKDMDIFFNNNNINNNNYNNHNSNNKNSHIYINNQLSISKNNNISSNSNTVNYFNMFNNNYNPKNSYFFNDNSNLCRNEISNINYYNYRNKPFNPKNRNIRNNRYNHRNNYINRGGYKGFNHSRNFFRIGRNKNRRYDNNKNNKYYNNKNNNNYCRDYNNENNSIIKLYYNIFNTEINAVSRCIDLLRYILMEYLQSENDDNDISYNLNDSFQSSKGVNENLLNSLTKIKVDDDSNLGQDKCIICLDNFKKGDELIKIPCTHYFHSNCIIEWFKNNNICPICKYEIK